MKPEDEKKLKKYFQYIKQLSFQKFMSEMNAMHTRAYAACQRHYREAMFICLTPKQRDAVEAKVIEIRELWDGMRTVTMEDTKADLLMENELVDELRALREENAALKARLEECQCQKSS